VTKTTMSEPSWPIAPTAKTAAKYTSASARNEKRSMMLPERKRPRPLRRSATSIRSLAAEDTDAPRSLSRVGSQFDRKIENRAGS